MHRVLSMGAEGFRACLERDARAEGFVVREVATFADGLDVLERSRPDVVVMGPADGTGAAHEWLEGARRHAHNQDLIALLWGGDAAQNQAFAAARGLTLDAGMTPAALVQRLLAVLGVPEGRPRRVPLQVLARVEVKEGEPAHFANTVDISVGGLGLISKEPLPLGRQVKVTFVLPGQGRVVLAALVRRLISPAELQYGLTLENLSDADRARVDAFVAARG